jgi:hypothetical protein
VNGPNVHANTNLAKAHVSTGKRPHSTIVEVPHKIKRSGALRTIQYSEWHNGPQGSNKYD